MKLSYTKVVSCYSQWFCKGFTLIELLVAIMIIGILAAVAVPQYQKAVMKSRFAAMMPIAKTLANANEVYYAEHDEYSTDPAKLNVTPQAGTPDGTAINMYSNPEEVSFVRVENPGVPNARYVVYQKLSENFPETTWCEAGDTRAEELCQTLGGTLPEGLTGNSSGDNTNYKAYLLTGQARSGDKFAEPVCLGAVCDENGNITECNSGETLNNGSCEDCATAFPGAATCSANSYEATSCNEGYTLNNGSCEECATAFPGAATCSATSYAATACGTGYTLNNGSCEDCATAFPNATACSPTSYAATSCSTGYVLNNGVCEEDLRLAAAQAMADTKCYNKSYGCIGIPNDDGTVSVCEKASASVNEEGKCIPNSGSSMGYETIYDIDGNRKEMYQCVYTNSSGGCYNGYHYIYNANGATQQARTCSNQTTFTTDLVCPNGAYSLANDVYYSSGSTVGSAQWSSQGACESIDANGNCTKYSKILKADSYSNAKVYSVCLSISNTQCKNNNYVRAYTTSGSSPNQRLVGCYPSSGNSNLFTDSVNADGTCPDGYRWKQKTGSSTYKSCSSYSSINWENATCS